MENRYDLVITGGAGGNPSHFETTIEPVRLSADCEIGLVSLHHGEVQNINSKNNKVHFYRGSSTVIELVKKKRNKPSYIPVSRPEQAESLLIEHFHTITLPVGRYGSSASILLEITNLIKDHLKTARKREAMDSNVTGGNNVINVDLVDLYILVENEADTPWHLLGVCEDKFDKFTIENKDLNLAEFPAILLTNLVQNSYINGKPYRNLSIVPIKTQPGWTMYRPATPYYLPITVREFSKIKMELRDMTGNCLQFNHGYNPIVTLNIRPIKGKDE